MATLPIKTTTSDNFGERISGIDARVESLTADIDILAKSVTDLRETVSRSFSLLSDRIAETGKPNMTSMASWAGVVLSVVAMAGGLVYTFMDRETARINSTLSVVTNREIDNAYDKGLYTERLNSQVRAFEARVLIEDGKFADMDSRRAQLEADVKRNTERAIASEQRLDALAREVLRSEREKN